MFRLGAQRSATLAQRAPTTSRIVLQSARFSTRPAVNDSSLLNQRARPLALTTYRANTALITRTLVSVPGTFRDEAMEKKFREGKLSPDPDLVSMSSSIHPTFGEVGQEEKEDDTDMMAGVKHDIKVIREVMALETVPREAINVGLAGVVPYLATSAATVFCAFEMTAAAKYGTGWLLSENAAEGMLHVLEPLQVGYGAVIISFLGAIHWGLEWAGYGGKQGYKRYAIGVIAPAVAWPTILLPVEYALISQFLAFNFLYAVDSSATNRGWTPPWYSSYRFILTGLVGISIVISLVGRGQIQDRIGQMPTATSRVMQLKELGLVDTEDTGRAGKHAEEEDQAQQ